MSKRCPEAVCTLLCSDQYVDLFGSAAWEETRHKVQRQAAEWRWQGFIGPTMAEEAELAYTGIVDAIEELSEEFSTDGRERVPA
ncbi:MAG: fructose 1,6-bisphosphatase [Anaerolineales bacterium]|nr:fructose 1,6-bisphosphatase [Anaerolineales bacterium]